MASPAFLTTLTLRPASPASRTATIATCTARPPNDPSELRTESERRRNSPPKPLRRRRRRRGDDGANLDWEAMTSVPLVRPDVNPESGEDYWMEIDAVSLSDPDMGDGLAKKRRKGRPIDERLKTKLKDEVVSPWKDNWILQVAVVIAVLIVLVAVFGGLDTIPIISVPDL